MKTDLHSIYLKHDKSFGSLAKQSLAQIALKIIYKNRERGIRLDSLTENLNSFLEMKFRQEDVSIACNHLKQHRKIYQKKNKFNIHQEYVQVIDSAVSESEILHQNVFKYWFGKSQSYQTEEGKTEVANWFKESIQCFFKNHQYDWMHDLRNKKSIGHKNELRISNIFSSGFDRFNICEEDKEWLVAQFIKYLKSERREDQELLWIYGSSMFAATLLTARNYADNFSLESFRDAIFLLDTNILLILELEAFKASYAFESIEKTFRDLSIKPAYLYISKEEYGRALNQKESSVLAAAEKYDFHILKKADCEFIQTALLRECRNSDDFKRFFSQMSTLPDRIYDDIEICCLDNEIISSVVEEGANDQNIKDKVNAFHFRRVHKNKTQNQIQHDAGLINAARHLRKQGKCWILTRDTTIREYACENAYRNDFPIAIGLDSFIQMMAINANGSSTDSTDFVPLFSKLIQSSLMVSKDTFQIEDLHFMSESKVDIDSLSSDSQMELARIVHTMRIKGLPDDEIVLEIQRYTQREKVKYEEAMTSSDLEKKELSTKNRKLEEENRIYKSERREIYIGKSTRKLKDKIKRNWTKMTFILVFIILAGYAIHILKPYSESYYGNLGISLLLGIITNIIFAIKLKYKLLLTRDDKERIKKEADIEINNIIRPVTNMPKKIVA